MEYSEELMAVGVPALLRATGNEGHYLPLHEISQEFCTPLLSPTPWLDLEWDPAGSCVTCLPHASLRPPSTGRQGPHTAQQSRSASPWAHVINEERTSFWELCWLPACRGGC